VTSAVGDGQMDAPPESTRRLSTPGTHDLWSLLLAFLFGAVGLPLMIIVGWLWLNQNWMFMGIESAGAAMLHGGAMGLCFGYLAGLAWGWPDGLVRPAAGVLVAVLALAAAAIPGRDDLKELAIGCAGAAIVGVVAYPVGLLARWVLVRTPLLGFASGGILLALGVRAIATSVPHFDPEGSTYFAPTMLVAGAGTLAISTWFAVRGSGRIGTDRSSG